MRTKNTFGVHFITRTNKGQSEMATIFARITVDGKDLRSRSNNPSPMLIGMSKKEWQKGGQPKSGN